MDKEAITLSIAVVGAVTGILALVFNFLNTWRAFDRDQVKLKVIPKIGISYHPALGGQSLLCIEVINNGYVPVTLSRVVFPVPDGSKTELHFVPSQLTDKPLPVRLEARESITIYAPAGFEISPEFAKVSMARAYTSCGRIFDGTSPALEGLVTKAKQASSLD